MATKSKVERIKQQEAINAAQGKYKDGVKKGKALNSEKANAMKKAIKAGK